MRLAPVVAVTIAGDTADNWTAPVRGTVSVSKPFGHADPSDAFGRFLDWLLAGASRSERFGRSGCGFGRGGRTGLT
jgi:hypothetical protein